MSDKPKKIIIRPQNNKIPVYILTVNRFSDKAKFTFLNYRKQGFKAIFFQGLKLEDPKRKSKIVYDSNKSFYNRINKKNIKFPMLFSEDDVSQEYTPQFIRDMAKKYPNKVVWLCYQKTFKEKGKDIPVGSQVYMVPNLKVFEKFKDLIDNGKPIHFDRWLSRQDIVVRPSKPKNMCAEIGGASATVGMRKGADLKKEEAKKITEPLKRGFKYTTITAKKRPKPSQNQ